MDINEVLDYLNDHNNDLMTKVDHDDDKLIEVASLLSTAAHLISLASDVVEEDIDEKLAESVLDDLVSVANAFDQSGNETLIKKASVIDELLLSIASDEKLIVQSKIASLQKLKEVREKFRHSQKELELKKRLRKVNKIDEAEKVLTASGVLEETKKKSPMTSARESRNCPDHPGVLMVHIAPSVWQCNLDKKVYDWNVGFKLQSGEEVSGGTVANQNYFPDYTVPAWASENKL